MNDESLQAHNSSTTDARVMTNGSEKFSNELFFWPKPTACPRDGRDLLTIDATCTLTANCMCVSRSYNVVVG